MAYGDYTKISVPKSIADITALVKKAGAARIAQVEEPEGFRIQFFLADRMLRFSLVWPDKATEQRRKQRARALLLVIKAKLESVESGIETFEEAFLANVVTPDGRTIGEIAVPQIESAYQGGAPVILQLEGPRG